ncbi:MAG: dihydroorotate dehydrogenase-like protein [Bacteroidales bacterium]
MADLSTKYMGLSLKNPVIVGSSGLTNSTENIIKIEQSGAGAVVLKSLFEEQIRYEVSKALTSDDESMNMYPEAMDYISNYSKNHKINAYLDLIRDSKAATDIPIIASINCVSATEWTSFAKKIQDAGADALELNVFVLPSDPNHGAAENEKLYFDLAETVLKQVSIPVSLKISHYFSGLARFTRQLSWTGIKGMVLFNRFFSPDIDINNFKVISTNVFSTPEEISISLHWVAMLSDILHCDISASTGVHDGQGVIKQLLAGATTVQVTSVLYKEGFARIPAMLNELTAWMDKNNFAKIEDFRGKMSYKLTENPAAYERMQFMKHFAGIE